VPVVHVPINQSNHSHEWATRGFVEFLDGATATTAAASGEIRDQATGQFHHIGSCCFAPHSFPIGMVWNSVSWTFPSVLRCNKTSILHSKSKKQQNEAGVCTCSTRPQHLACFAPVGTFGTHTQTHTNCSKMGRRIHSSSNGRQAGRLS
jgi:hypothetical protein